VEDIALPGSGRIALTTEELVAVIIM